MSALQLQNMQKFHASSASLRHTLTWKYLCRVSLQLRLLCIIGEKFRILQTKRHKKAWLS